MDAELHLSTLQRANARFAEAAAAAVLEHGWGARVPGCPDWTLADLVWHRAEVQDFWAWVVGTRAQDPSAYQDPDRRPDDELLGYLAGRSARLEAVLAGAEPAEPVWTWGQPHDVGFVLRFQAMEATVHAFDAEDVLGDVRAVPADVGLAGVDTWLELLLPATLPSGPPAEAHPVVLHAVDADAERTLFPGTRPFPIASLTGNAGDLLLALWRRVPIEVLTVDGDSLQAAAMIGLVRTN